MSRESYLTLNFQYSSLRTADVFPVVASLPPKNFSEGEKRRLEIRLLFAGYQHSTVALLYGTPAVRLTESTWISHIGVPSVLSKATQFDNRRYPTLSVGLPSSPAGTI